MRHVGLGTVVVGLLGFFVVTLGFGLPLQQSLKIERHQVGLSKHRDHGDMMRQATEMRKQIPNTLSWA